jgi:hypothetical protein
MTMKHSAVLEAVQMVESGGFEAGAPTFEWAPPLSGDSAAKRERITELELDYQIALLPFPTRGSGAAPKKDGVSQLLLLPLTWNEFIAQVRGEMVRPSVANESNVARFGQVRVDLLAMEVSRSGSPVRLTAMEFKVLRFFLSNPHRVISRDELLNQVWGYDNYPCTRTVDNHVLRLRQKLESVTAHPAHFRTVHGIGYKFIP